MSETITRGEFTMLAQRVTENVHRLDQIDQAGTRGVGSLAVQVHELVKDVTKGFAEVERWQAAHETLHETDKRERRLSRRWAWGWGLAALIALEAPLISLLLHQH